MAKVRKRTWGGGRQAWVADYTDQAGKRRLKTFKTKRDADAWLLEARQQVKAGTHIPESHVITVTDAARRWLINAEARGLERATLAQYRQHVDIHIVPELGCERIARLNRERVEDFLGRLLQTCSRAMATKVMVTLRSILRSAGRPFDDVRLPRGNGRHQRKLEVGHDIPWGEEVKRLLTEARYPARAVLALAALAGLRSSEIRGLRWMDLDLAQRTVTIRQRADRWSEIGSPKSKDARRTVPLGPEAVRILKEWKLASPQGMELVFPTEQGRPLSYSDLQRRIVQTAQIAARARTRGLHAFRHFYASWQLSQGVQLKVLQHRMGHSTIVLTADRYGHLMPETEDERARADAAERALLA